MWLIYYCLVLESIVYKDCLELFFPSPYLLYTYSFNLDEIFSEEVWEFLYASENAFFCVYLYINKLQISNRTKWESELSKGYFISEHILRDLKIHFVFNEHNDMYYKHTVVSE